MRILLTNDDGIDAPGIAALAMAAEGLGELHTYAPKVVQSGCSHRLTTDTAIALAERSVDRVAVDGTPGDCVRLAFARADGEFDWILSGINDGGNLGVDVFYSGTVAAVREGAILGKPGIALSHYIKRDLPIDWKRVARWTRRVVAELMRREHIPGTFWSVNFPHLEPGTDDPPMVYCPLDTNPLPLHYSPHDEGHKYSGVYAQRERTAGADVDVCFSGKIAVTRLSTCHGCDAATGLESD